MKDYYEILEVHPKASMDIIKKAYTTLAKKYHPDTTTFDKSFAQSKMIQINEAYSVLSDSEKRSDYDRSYFSSSNTRNEKSQKQKNKKHNEGPHTESYDDSIESSPAGQFAIQLCTETLLELKDSIIREKHNEKRNSEICNRIDAKLDNNLKSALQVIDNSTGYKRNIYYIVGMLYWQMASAYTWTDNRQGPLKYIELAEKYIPKDADYYDYYCKSRSAVYNNEQISQMNDKYRETQKKVWLKRIAFLLIVAIGLYLSSSGGSNSTRNKSYPTTQTQKNRQLNNKNRLQKEVLYRVTMIPIQSLMKVGLVR